jgi:hypothetical protein
VKEITLKQYTKKMNKLLEKYKLEDRDDAFEAFINEASKYRIKKGSK